MYFQCPGRYMVGTLSMSLQCICSVPAWYTTLCPQCPLSTSHHLAHLSPGSRPSPRNSGNPLENQPTRPPLVRDLIHMSAAVTEGEQHIISKSTWPSSSQVPTARVLRVVFRNLTGSLVILLLIFRSPPRPVPQSHLGTPDPNGLIPTLSSHYFSRSFFDRFLNLVTHTLVHLSRFSLVILVIHLAFTLSTCYSTNDSHELL